MLVETPEANLVAGMQWLQGTYTQRFHCRHRHCGHPANLPGYIRTVVNGTNPLLLDLRTRILKSED